MSSHVPETRRRGTSLTERTGSGLSRPGNRTVATRSTRIKRVNTEDFYGTLAILFTLLLLLLAAAI